MVTYIETRQISSSIYLILEHDRAGQGGSTERVMRVDEFHNAQCDALRVAVTQSLKLFGQSIQLRRIFRHSKSIKSQCCLRYLHEKQEQNRKKCALVPFIFI
jgi:hypothetical protein